MHNQSNFETPRKVLFHKNHASEVKTNIVTPSLPQSFGTCHKKTKSNLAFVIASTLALNAKSEIVFRPKRRPCKAPPTQKAFPPLKKSISLSLNDSSSSSSSTIVSKSACSSKFHLDSSESSSFATLTLRDSNSKNFEETKKKIACLKKRANLLSEKLEDRKVESIFKNKKASKSFIRSLNSLDSFHPHTLNLTSSAKVNIQSTCSFPRFESSSELCKFYPARDDNKFASEIDSSHPCASLESSLRFAHEFNDSSLEFEDDEVCES